MNAPNPSLCRLDLPSVGAPPLVRVPEPRRTTLANGLRLATVARAGLPQITLRLTIPAGSAAEPIEHMGTAALVGSLITEGTEHYTAAELNERLDSLGASVSVHVGHDFAHVDLVLLSETLSEGIELMAEIVIRPTFPADEVERVRAETIDMLLARGDEPANVADDRFSVELFGPDHPYGRLSMGTEPGVAEVPRQSLVDFHHRFYRPGESFLVAAGDFDEDELRNALETAFDTWEGAAKGATSARVEPSPSGWKTVKLDWPDAMQSEIRVGGLGISRNSPDWIPASVANFILGGSTITGRLGANLREDKGWTYGVRSGFAAGLETGGWAVETAVDVEVADDAVIQIVHEITRMVSEPVAQEDLRRAKDAIILSLPRAFETPGRIVSRIAGLMAYDLPESYWETYAPQVEAVTAEHVLSMANKYFHPDRLVRVLVG